MQLIQQVLISVVVRLHRDRRPGLLLCADVVAKPLIGQRGVVVPLGRAVGSRDAVQRVHGLLIEAVGPTCVGEKVAQIQ